MKRQDDEEFNIGNIEEYFQKSSDEIIKSHSDVIDKAFDFILEYAVPKFTYKYFNLFDQPLNLSYESIKKFNKMTKYHQAAFLRERSVSPLYELLLKFNPNIKQFNFATQVQNPKEREFKYRITNAAKLLISARDEIRRTALEMMALRRVIVKNKIYSYEQVILIKNYFKSY